MWHATTTCHAGTRTPHRHLHEKFRLCPCLQLHSTIVMWNPHVRAIFNLENLYAQACRSGRRHLLGSAHVGDWATRASGWSPPFPRGLAGARRGTDVVPPWPAHAVGGRRRPQAGRLAVGHGRDLISRGWCAPHPSAGRRPFLCPALHRTREARSHRSLPCTEGVKRPLIRGD
jgi:hypothetical protein